MIRKLSLYALLALASLGDAQGAIDAANELVDSTVDAGNDAAKNSVAVADTAADDASADAKAAAKKANLNKAVASSKSEGDWLPDYDGDLWIGISSCVGLLWWFLWGWFVYIKTNDSDYTMQKADYTSGVIGELLPIAWFWGNTGSPNVGWTAIQYLWVWLSYLLVAGSQFVVWMLWLLTDEKNEAGENVWQWLFEIWAQYVGLYGSWVLYFFTVLFPILQMGQINGDVFLPGWTNAILQVSMMTLTWLGTGVIYLLRELKRQYNAPAEGTAPAKAAVPAEEKAADAAVKVVEDAVREEAEPDQGADW